MPYCAVDEERLCSFSSRVDIDDDLKGHLSFLRPDMSRQQNRRPDSPTGYARRVSDGFTAIRNAL